MVLPAPAEERIAVCSQLERVRWAPDVGFVTLLWTENLPTRMVLDLFCSGFEPGFFPKKDWGSYIWDPSASLKYKYEWVHVLPISHNLYVKTAISALFVMWATHVQHGLLVPNLMYCIILLFSQDYCAPIQTIGICCHVIGICRQNR